MKDHILRATLLRNSCLHIAKHFFHGIATFRIGIQALSQENTRVPRYYLFEVVAEGSS